MSVDAGTWAGLTLAPGVIAPADASDAHRLVAAGLRLGLHATIAVTGTTVVGAALSHRPNGSGPEEILAVGVAPAWRRRGIARELLAAHVATGDLAATGMTAEVTVAERDPLQPLDVALRRDIARRLLGGAGFDLRDATGPVRAADPFAISAVRPAATGAAR